MLVVWDSIKGIPIKTIFDPHVTGVEAVAISHDSMYVATLSKPIPLTPEQQIASQDLHSPSTHPPKSAEKETKPDAVFTQELSIWEWTSERTKPVYHSKIQGLDLQFAINFHPSDTKLLISNGKDRVTFWLCHENKLLYNAISTKYDLCDKCFS